MKSGEKVPDPGGLDGPPPGGPDEGGPEPGAYCLGAAAAKGIFTVNIWGNMNIMMKPLRYIINTLHINYI